MNLLDDILIELMSEFNYNSDTVLNRGHAVSRFIELMERLNSPESINKIDNNVLKHFLTVSSKPEFLTVLPSDSYRNQWAELCFSIIQKTNYTLYDLMQAKTAEHPDKILFCDMSLEKPDYYSYTFVNRFTEEIAAFIYYLEPLPKVAIFSDNTFQTACVDLACLFYDILDTPISTHFDNEILKYIFDLMRINIVVTNTEDRFKKLLELRSITELPFKIIVTSPDINTDYSDTYYLSQESKKISMTTAKDILNARTRMLLNEVSTVMFTSGSTGKPKGVAFSNYNLISKRFARGAAVPEIGNQEVMLSYLPLFHTFGRYLEMLGTIYWSGTYTFAGNSSSDNLINLFPIVNPSIFISIPLRWVQLYERIIENTKGDSEYQVRQIVGKRLRWGLSAAGFMEPKVFKYFEKHGINLCSGFGMTEATGGITMTPPAKYIEGTNGIALPGIYLRQSNEGELEIRGHYTARYIEDAMPGQVIPFPESDDKDKWLKTGDIFSKNEQGYYEIIDRVKDIYKNNKGQTIAPLRVENRFTGVPGIKRTYLVGDGRAYNVLFIIPDHSDPFFADMMINAEEYFHQLVTSANKDLANYERVVNFTILDRDFNPENGELTPKGSLNRKVIEKNFIDKINQSYISDYIDFKFNSFTIRLPRWFYRDLGILEDDIVKTDTGLYDKHRDLHLTISRYFTKDNFIIGNLEYSIKNKVIELGLIARQPKLWIANPEFVAFAPCKDGWDIPLLGIATQLYLPWNYYSSRKEIVSTAITGIKDKSLIELNKVLSSAIFSNGEAQVNAIIHSANLLKVSENRVSDVIRRRLEVLARHPEEYIRCLSYRLLLLDEPQQNYDSAFPAFIESGLSFLNSESIKFIATEKLERRRLEALRIRLFEYRKQLNWPSNFQTRQQFINIFRLLINFVKYNPDYYNSVRTELCNWVLHNQDSELSKIALEYFKELSNTYENQLVVTTKELSHLDLDSKFIYDDSLSEYDIQSIKSIIYKTTFLKQSIILAFDEIDFDLSNVPAEGIWISKIKTVGRNGFFRISIITNNRKHFDLQMITGEDLKLYQSNQTIYWLFTIAGYPFGSRVLPKLGTCRPELSARSMVYNGDLTFWEKVRQLSEENREGRQLKNPNILRKLFTTGITTFFRAWRNSNYKITPGIVSPDNVVVPELDYVDGAMILSISGWKEYVNTLTLIKPLIKNFYQRTLYHYPWTRYQLDLNWLFDACMEALGEKQAFVFFGELAADLNNEKFICLNDENLLDILNKYTLEYGKNFYLPMALLNAVERYHDWFVQNPNASSRAKEETIIELQRLYQINTYHEYVRYMLYRDTYYRYSSPNVLKAFDEFLEVFAENRSKTAIQILELSNIQQEIDSDEDRAVLSRLVFPKNTKMQLFEMEKFGDKDKGTVIIKTHICDRLGHDYSVREALHPTEIGHLYRLFYKQNIPINITTLDKYFIVFDSNDKVMGGICYRVLDDRIVFMENAIIESQYKNRGIAAALIDDFCSRMANNNIEIIKTHYYLENFFKKFGFKVDTAWGALVKFLK